MEPATYRGRCATHSAEQNTRQRNTTSAAYHTPEWRRARSIALQRGYHQCCHCGGVNQLHVHHIDHDNTNHDQSNLAVLCAGCHMRLEKDAFDAHAIEVSIQETKQEGPA
jgi:5-methylcytosine-specific restriction endonuclease McrA